MTIGRSSIRMQLTKRLQNKKVKKRIKRKRVKNSDTTKTKNTTKNVN